MGKIAKKIFISEMPNEEVDVGWCWVIAAACCWISFVVQGLVRCAGIIYVALIDSFDITRQEASWPFTLRIAIWNLTGPLAGILSYHWSIRTIMFTGSAITTLGNFLCFVITDVTYITLFFGILQGFGTGLLMTLLPVIINQYFVRHKTTAVGIACAGATIGSFAMPPLIDYLLNQYALSGSFLLMSGIILNALVGVSLLRPPIQKKKCNVLKDETLTFMTNNTYENYKNIEENMYSDVTDSFIKKTSLQKIENEISSGIFIRHLNLIITVLQNPMFILISVNYVVFFLCYMTYLMVVVDFAIDLKIEENDAAFLVSSFSISDMVGRLGSGWITDKGWVKRKNLLMVTMIIIGAVLSLTPWMRTYTYLSILAIIYGLLVGSTLIVFFALLEEYVGLDNLPVAVGLMTFLNGCGAFVIPILTGHFRDRSGNYDYLFYVLSAASLICGLLWIIQWIKQTINIKKENF